MIDAEQTYIQYGIDSITRQLQRTYNKDKVLIMNTFQAYLKRNKRNVCIDVLGCKMMNIPFGAKLVRGAYITEESKIALDQEVESPVFPNKLLVDKGYDETMEFVINNVPPRSHFTVASHNDATIDMALEEVNKRQKELEENKSQISFAQLKGLGDRITYRLAQKGHYTFKYLPYGPTHNLVPYLFRRAEEASYIWLEGKKTLVDVKKELFEVRKLHYKLCAGMAASLLLLMVILHR